MLAGSSEKNFNKGKEGDSFDKFLPKLPFDGLSDVV